MHTDFACLLFSHLRRRPHPKLVEKIITEAVATEQEFLADFLWLLTPILTSPPV
jgi:ribonucleoside-diphosphate reductase subunit M2